MQWLSETYQAKNSIEDTENTLGFGREKILNENRQSNRLELVRSF